MDGFRERCLVPHSPLCERTGKQYHEVGMEVCVDSVESAINAERGGASRIELCCNLLEGGTTPSYGLLQVVKQQTHLPVFVMVRPRGGDFLYSEHEIAVMRADLKGLRACGADGIVFGVLTKAAQVNVGLCRELLSLCSSFPVTFHRAFDMVQDPVTALEDIISLGFSRVLTSGGELSALDGLPMIRKLIEQANGRITVVPGGGITERNLQRILEGSGACEFHCSASTSRDSDMQIRNGAVRMGTPFCSSEFSIKVADASRVRTLCSIAKGIL